MRGSKEDRSPAEQMFLGGLKWGSKLENRNAPSGDPPPSKETYSLRVETDGGGSDSWKGGGGVVYAKRASYVARGIDPFPFRSKLRGKIAHISFRT